MTFLQLWPELVEGLPSTPLARRSGNNTLVFKHGSFRVWGYKAQAKKRYLRPFVQALKHLLIYYIFKVLSRPVDVSPLKVRGD